MKNAFSLICLSSLLTLTLGCASAYHSYSGCYVDCNYCPPPPLPYSQYDGCVCHSHAASPYLAMQPQWEEQADEGHVPDEPTE